jgi:hypothetical protein
MKNDQNLGGESLLNDEKLEGITGGTVIGTKTCEYYITLMCPYVNGNNTDCPKNSRDNCNDGEIPINV